MNQLPKYSDLFLPVLWVLKDGQDKSIKEIPMLKINNRKLEDQIKQILQQTSHASAEKYLIARVAREHLVVKRGKNLP